MVLSAQPASARRVPSPRAHGVVGSAGREVGEFRCPPGAVGDHQGPEQRGVEHQSSLPCPAVRGAMSGPTSGPIAAEFGILFLHATAYPAH